MNLKQRLQMEQKEFQTLESKYSFKRMRKDEPEEILATEQKEEAPPSDQE